MRSLGANAMRLILIALLASSAFAQFRPPSGTGSGISACAATPPTSGAANSYCKDALGITWTCSNGTSACTLAGQWTVVSMSAYAVLNNQANTYTTGLQDFSIATWKIPTSAGFVASASSMLGFDSTGTAIHVWQGAADHALGTAAFSASSTFQAALTNYSTISGLTGYPSTFPPTTTGLALLGSANTYTTGLQDFSLATWKVPTGAGFTASASSMFGYDSTAGLPHVWAGADRTICLTIGCTYTGTIQGSGYSITAAGAGSFASLASTGGYTSGSSPPAVTWGTGGGSALAEGTAPGAGPAAGVDLCYSDATAHGLLCSFNNDTASMMARIGAANTFTTAQTVSGAPIIISGNISAAAWTTNGVRIKGVPGVLTDTSSTGTVAAAYTDVMGGNTINGTNTPTFTHYYTMFAKAPVAGTATITNPWAIGGESMRIGTSNQFTVSTTGHVTAEGVTSTGATGAGAFVFGTSPTLTTPSMTPQVIDCHTTCSPTAAQLSNAEVANYGQTASSIAITGPTLAAGMNFIMIVGTAQGANYWHYTSTTANVYLDAAGPYTTVGFATPAVGNSISCFSFQTGSTTYSLRCVTLNGTSSGS